MTPDQWDELTVEILARWPIKEIPEKTFEIWYEDLAEFPAEQVATAITALYRDGREWCPNGAQIRIKLLESADDRPDHAEAYTLAMEAIKHGGYYTGMTWLKEQSPLVAEAAELYGWDAWCRDGDTAEGTRKAQFRDIFNLTLDRHKAGKFNKSLVEAGKENIGAGPKRIGEVAKQIAAEAGE